MPLRHCGICSRAHPCESSRHSRTPQVASHCCNSIRADEAAAAVIQALSEIGVEVAVARLLDNESVTPLIVAFRTPLFEIAQALHAGANLNGLSKDGEEWPLATTAGVATDISMAWLLTHGASLALTDAHCRTAAHVLAAKSISGHADTGAAAAAFCSRWLRRCIAAEPNSLEARDAHGRTPLLVAAVVRSEACVAALLELVTDIGAADVNGSNVLSAACDAASVPVVKQLIAPGSHSILVASAAMVAALGADRGCGDCAARGGGSERGRDCADRLDVLRLVLAAGVREPVGFRKQLHGFQVMSWLRHTDSANSISVKHDLTVLQTLHVAGVNVLAWGPADVVPILHAVAEVDSPAVVRWLVAVAGTPLEERDSGGYPPLLAACFRTTTAHALLDLGARVDVQSRVANGWWPVILDTCCMEQRLRGYALFRSAKRVKQEDHEEWHSISRRQL
jgi:hypothetical protein